MAYAKGGTTIAFFNKSIPLVGLDIGTNTLRAVQLKRAPGLPLLTNYGKLSVPVGSVSEGEVVDVDALSQSVAQLWKVAGIRKKQVIVGVANQKVVVRLIELPFVRGEELKGSIRYQAQEFIPIPIEDAVIDYQVTNEFVNENGDKMMEVLLVAAQKDMIQNVVLTVQKAGLRPEVIDVSSFAIVRSVVGEMSLLPREEREGPEEAIGLIHLGAGVTNIVIVDEGIPRFTRTTTLAGNSLTKMILEQLSIPFDEAEEIKIKYGLPVGGAKGLEGLSKKEMEQAKLAQEVIEKESLKLVTEIRRSLDYYLAQSAKVKVIKRVYLTGGGSRLKNLPAFLASNLQLKAEAGDPLERVKISSSLPEEEVSKEGPSLAVAIGLALRGLVT